MDNNTIEELGIEDLWEIYQKVHDRLKEIGQIRSKNIVGDLGEQIAINYYNKTRGLPKLQISPPSTKNIDAISVKGERYSIKTISHPNKTTSVFHGYGTPELPLDGKLFEYLIIVVLQGYSPYRIYELDWETFYKLKKWHSTMKAYNISLTGKVINSSRIIYE